MQGQLLAQKAPHKSFFPQCNSHLGMEKCGEEDLAGNSCGATGITLEADSDKPANPTSFLFIGDRGYKTAVSAYGASMGDFYFEVEVLPPLKPLPFEGV